MPALELLYVVSRWGEPTETFVRREVAAALAAGHRITVLSLRRPLNCHPVVDVIHLSPSAAAVRALRTSVRHPLRAARVLARCVRYSRPSFLPRSLPAVVIGLAAASGTSRPDWIQAHFAWVAATAADAIATVQHCPWGIFAHAHDLFSVRCVDGYTTDKLRRADLVLVESDRIAAEVEQRFGVGPAVQRMGVPPEFVLADVPDRPDGILLSVGSLLPKKGHDDLVRAAGRLDRTIRLRILGEGPERQKLTELAGADALDLPGAVPAEAVASHLDQAGLFCLASKPTPDGDRDGVPNVLIEAMARGVPVVATAVSGIPDLVGSDRGWLVPPDDPVALCRAMEDALRDRGKARRRADAALAHIRERYTTDRNWLLLERLILDRVGRAPSRRH